MVQQQTAASISAGSAAHPLKQRVCINDQQIGQYPQIAHLAIDQNICGRKGTACGRVHHPGGGGLVQEILEPRHAATLPLPAHQIFRAQSLRALQNEQPSPFILIFYNSQILPIYQPELCFTLYCTVYNMDLFVNYQPTDII